MGAAAGQVLFPTQLPAVVGPRIGDHNTTTSSLGDPVVIGYGTFPSTGTVIFLGPLVEHASTTTQGGGSGGPTQSTTSYTYTQSIGIGLCETTSMDGVNVPIVGITRIWENGELVYDTRPQQPDESYADYTKRVAYSTANSDTFVLYLGTEDQEQDPTIELQQGANTPFFRGLAYIVYPDRALRSDQGVRHPSFRFEIVKAASTKSEVIFPTFLPGADVPTGLGVGTYPQVIAVDWLNGRYYILNTIDPAVPHRQVLGFNILNNTQFATADLGPAQSDGLGIAISPDPRGFVIVTNATNTVRLDPLSLAVVTTSVVNYGQEWQFGYTTGIANCGLGPIYLVCVIEAFGTVSIFDGLSLDPYGIFAYGFAAQPSVCAGLPEGGAPVFWVLTKSSMTPGDVVVDKLLWVCPNIITKASTRTFSPTDFDSSFTSIGRAGDLLVDPSDGHVMFRVTDEPSGTSYVFKYDGDKGVIDWVTPIEGGANITEGIAQNLVGGGAWWITDNPNGLYDQVNTSTGEVTYVDDRDALFTATGFVPGSGAAVTAAGFNGGAILSTINFQNGWALILPNAMTPGPVLIRDIVADLSLRSNLPYDISAMGTETVDGYTIATVPMTGRDAMVPLRPLGFFDSCESGDVMRYVRRGGPAAMMLDATDLGAYETGTSTDPAPGNVVSTSLESDLPFQLRLSYTSPSRDYQPGQQLSPARYDTMSEQITDTQLGGVCIGDDQAAQAAEINWNDAWQSDKTYTFAVDMSKAAIEPTDILLVPMVDELMRVRVTAIDDASQILRTITAVSDDDGTYVSSAIAATAPPPVTMKFFSDSTLLLIDSPLLLDSNDTGRVSAPMYMAAYPNGTDSWSGATILESDNAGATYTNVGPVTAAPTTGVATTVLANDTQNVGLTDTVNSVSVQIQAGQLPASITTDQLLSGGNAAAMIDPDGSVELFQFRDVTVIDADTVTLSYLIRGARGSDTMTASHTIGSRFVMLGASGTIQKTNLPLTDVDEVLEWKAVGSNDTITDAQVVPFASQGRSLMPHAPVHVRVVNVAGDLIVHATRRARIGASEWDDGDTEDPPLAEDSEAYSLDIYDSAGAHVLRTIPSTSLPITYTGADATTDLGGVPTDYLTVALYQLSRQVGRGFAYKVKQPIGPLDVEGTLSIPVPPPRTSYPIFTPGTGSVFTDTLSVEIADTDETGTVIYYTMDGSLPAVGVGTTQVYTAPITVSIVTTIKAFAVAPGKLPSFLVEALYTLEASTGVGGSGGTGGGGTGGGGGGGGGVGSGPVGHYDGSPLAFVGNALTNATGIIVGRGANLSGMETVTAAGGPVHPFYGNFPNITLFKAWGFTFARVPLNANAIMAYSVRPVNGSGNGWSATATNADFYGDYMSELHTLTAALHAQGIIVIYDMHWSMPQFTFGPDTAYGMPQAQSPYADLTTKAAWGIILGIYGSNITPLSGVNNGNIIFEFWNECFLDQLYTGSTLFNLMKNGGTATSFKINGGPTIAQSWTVYGTQNFIDDVVASGAQNPCLFGGPGYAKEIANFAQWMPVDSRGQSGVSWHPYSDGTYGTVGYEFPGVGTDPGSQTPAAVLNALAVLRAGYALFITEDGDHFGPGANATHAAFNIDMATSMGITYIAWAFQVGSSNPSPTATGENYLVDSSNNPTIGFGQTIHDWSTGF